MAREIWQVDPANSRLTFTIRHLIVAEISGRVLNWRATLDIDSERPIHSTVEAVLDARSIDTENAERDDHIRSAEFLNVDTHPEIRFLSRTVSHVEANRYLIVGDLTIRNVTREVTLEMEHLGISVGTDDVPRAAFHVHATVNRQHFRLHWNQDLDTGGVVLGDKVDINIDVEAVAGEQSL